MEEEDEDGGLEQQGAYEMDSDDEADFSQKLGDFDRQKTVFLSEALTIAMKPENLAQVGVSMPQPAEAALWPDETDKVEELRASVEDLEDECEHQEDEGNDASESRDKLEKLQEDLSATETRMKQRHEALMDFQQRHEAYKLKL